MSEWPLAHYYPRGEGKMGAANSFLLYLSFDEMTDPHFGHDGNGNRLDDLFDHVWVALEKEKWESKKKVPEGICSSDTDARRRSLALAIRATPPVARISAGTRSSAMTAHAPASSAIRA